MKIITTELNSAPMYKTVYLSSAHLSEEMRAVLLAMADKPDCYYCHRTTGYSDAGIILRFKTIGGDDWSDIEDQLLSDGLNDELTGLIGELSNHDIDAVHFDQDFDLVAGFHWYTDDGQKVIPLAYGVNLDSFHDLDEVKKNLVLQNFEETEEDAEQNYYFEADGSFYNMADFMRLDDNSEMKSYGFAACCGESNTSALFIMLSDDSDRVDLVRVV
ncbi:hypothetical protein SLP22_0073 [Salmonella phage BAU.Micro_SLP-22]|nr:hypothetical protein SLP22_00007 [Salmonella phage BAU.Micro_SLP-22]